MKILDITTSQSGAWIFSVDVNGIQTQISVSTEEQMDLKDATALASYLKAMYPTPPSFVMGLKGQTL